MTTTLAPLDLASAAPMTRLRPSTVSAHPRQHQRFIADFACRVSLGIDQSRPRDFAAVTARVRQNEVSPASRNSFTSIMAVSVLPGAAEREIADADDQQTGVRARHRHAPCCDFRRRPCPMAPTGSGASPASRHQKGGSCATGSRAGPLAARQLHQIRVERL